MPDALQLFIIISKFTGFLSICGAGYMIVEILLSKEKRKRTYFRLMLGMNFIEFWDGVAFFLGSWCVPPPAFWAAGNEATCIFQGFLLQASIGSTLYNSFLALYYLLSIKYDWPERLIAKKVEPWMHGISMSVAYCTAIAAAFLGLYASYGNVCYISKTPLNCKETYQYGYTTCTQGDNSSLYLIFFFTIWQWASVAFTALSMLLIWCHIRNHEKKMAEYAYADRPTRKDSRRFAKQGFLYVLVFYFCHFFATVTLYYIRTDFDPNVLTALMIMYALTYPLEGFLNFLVYMRPRINKYLKEKKENFKMSSNCAPTEIATEIAKDMPETAAGQENNDKDNNNNDSDTGGENNKVQQQQQQQQQQEALDQINEDEAFVSDDINNSNNINITQSRSNDSAEVDPMDRSASSRGGRRGRGLLQKAMTIESMFMSFNHNATADVTKEELLEDERQQEMLCEY